MARYVLALAVAVGVLHAGNLCAAPRGVSSAASVVDQRLHMSIAGKRGPVVILEAGFSSDSRSWRRVKPLLAEFSRVVTYDRAGLGRSPVGKLPRTASRIATDLHRALQNAGVRPPFVLVAHSAGALYSRVFAHLYPDEMRGFVFVEPAPPAYYAWFRRHNPKAWQAAAAEAAASSPGAKGPDGIWP